jgi:excisionase family DNA binding protein
MKQYVRLGDVARALAVSNGTLRAACKRGEIPFVRVHGDVGHYRIPAEVADAMCGEEAAPKPQKKAHRRS